MLKKIVKTSQDTYSYTKKCIGNMLMLVIKFASQDCKHSTTAPPDPSPPPTGGWNLEQLVVRELSGGIYIDATVFAAVREFVRETVYV